MGKVGRKFKKGRHESRRGMRRKNFFLSFEEDGLRRWGKTVIASGKEEKEEEASGQQRRASFAGKIMT